MREGQVAKRSNATDCKSVGFGLRRFESFPAHSSIWISPASPKAFSAEGRRMWEWGTGWTSPQSQFRSRELFFAGVTQLVESQPSKLLVAGSSPVSRSNHFPGLARGSAEGGQIWDFGLGTGLTS